MKLWRRCWPRRHVWTHTGSAGSWSALEPARDRWECALCPARLWLRLGAAPLGYKS